MNSVGMIHNLIVHYGNKDNNVKQYQQRPDRLTLIACLHRFTFTDSLILLTFKLNLYQYACSLGIKPMPFA